jgi:hypothetical protein
VCSSDLNEVLISRRLVKIDPLNAFAPVELTNISGCLHANQSI